MHADSKLGKNALCAVSVTELETFFLGFVANVGFVYEVLTCHGDH